MSIVLLRFEGWLWLPSSRGGSERPDPNRRRRLEPGFLPDDVLGRGLNDGVWTLTINLTSQRGRSSGFGLSGQREDAAQGFTEDLG
ncbi:hypothetical protein NQZ68_007644 [Dissostichus eleginoides]|nr:hypothetical protein NQZ68_007644 [Dissostichus eleginoides]